MIKTKTCNKCNVEKNLTEFYYRTDVSDWRPECKNCIKQSRVVYRQSDEYKKMYKKYTNKKETKEKIKRNMRKRVVSGKSRIYDNIRYNTNINFKLAKCLRARFNSHLKNIKKGKLTSAVTDLGIDLGEFIKYIESKWTEGMTWNNYGKDTLSWNIDHIKPLAAFDLTTKEEQKKANHHKNLQPMWASDNYSKGAKFYD